MSMDTKKRINPWAWVSTLYFAEGLPYVAVMTIAVIMYKNLGMSNTDIALYTSWLYLPWVIKPIWSPFVDLMKTKRFWIIAMQFLLGVGFAGVAFFINTNFYVQSTLAVFWLMAFSSATHDIAADGYYMIALDQKQQSFFVGIRNIFYRFSVIFGQGLVVMFAGLLADGSIIPSVKGNVPLSWSIAFFLMAGLFIGLALYHYYILPKAETRRSESEPRRTPLELLKDFWKTFTSFFAKDGIGLAFFFILTYRLGESQLVKIASPFFLDTVEKGGMGLTTAQVGVINGTVGVIALLLGGMLGGVLVSKQGLRKWIVPMAIAINLPDVLYVVLSLYNEASIVWAAVFVALEQFGYGLGFTAYTLYLIHVAKGEFKTAHYAIGTGFMALGMMVPGMIAGWMQEQLGYTMFFVWVCVATLPGIIASILVKRYHLK